MPLTPTLDDRTFEDLFREARARIPRYIPEWTDWNESDPGITLLQLQSWLTETILFRLNQLPDLAYVKFLQMLGVEQRPASPAQADLTFLLKEKAGSPEVIIPKGAVVGVAARDLPEPISFETDRALTAISARLAQLYVFDDVQSPTPEVTDVTQANALDGQVFFPFGDPAWPNAALLLAFSSPQPFSREQIGLQFYLAEEGQAILAAPDDSSCGVEVADAGGPRLAWQWWDGLRWDDLTLVGDETNALTRSGQVTIRVPGQIPAVPARAVRAEPVFLPPRLTDVAGIAEADAAKLHVAGVETVDALAATQPSELLTTLEIIDPQPADEERVKAILADAKRLSQQSSPLYYWLRVVFQQGAYTRAPKLDRVATNTVRATAALTVYDEAVGSSDGSPNQVLVLRHFPVLADPPLRLEVDEGDGPKKWTQVHDLAGSREDSTHYVLNRATGQIRFGDGRHGRIPVAGQFNVVARKYRYGGGRAGNTGANTITELVTRVANFESVTNHRAAVGGEDEELLADTRLRAPQELFQVRDRAVTLEDFAFLAQATPGALVARAFAYVSPAVLFRPGDVIGAPRFVRQALTNNWAISRYLRSQFDLALLTLLDESRGSEPGGDSADSVVLRSALADNLNRILENGPLYEADRFADVTLSDAAQRLLALDPRGDDLVLLNRLLLVDAYQELLAPLSQPWSGRLITVVIVPQSKAAKPVPSEAARRLVCRYLDERRLLTTQVRVTGPVYHDVEVHLSAWAAEQADLKTVKTAIEQRLAAYFHPLQGGARGEGWPFGQNVYYSELLREIMLLPDVLRVERLEMWKLIERWPTEEAANARRNSLQAAVDSQRAAEPGVCLPDYEVLRVATPGETKDEPVREDYYLVAVYDCCDLPVHPGALLALRRAQVSVSYPPPRGGR